MAVKKNEQIEWLLAIAAGFFVSGLSLALGLQIAEPVPLWLVLPFVTLLLAIALTPLVRPAWWHSNYPDVSLFLGSLVTGLYAFGLDSGPYKLLHAGLEYLSFLALIGGLFFVVSCIQLDVKGKARPIGNLMLLLLGAVFSNLVGTTGASLLLIRPFIKLNRGRIKPLHVVFFIIIVSNCGGALTPIGDPPLYLGYLKGVPFFWTFNNLLPSWCFVVAALLIAFYIFDRFFAKDPTEDADIEKINFKISGKVGIISLVLMIAAIFIDPILAQNPEFKGIPITAMAQVIIASSCFLLTPQRIKQANEFTFEPFREVALIFAGIFATMIPALDYLSVHGKSFGIDSASTFYFATGILSAFLDNAPTYLNFLQVAVGPTEINKESISALLATPFGNSLLISISSGAVFFGAMTYIGNGPNFMVRSIAQSMKIKTPSFFGYLGWTSIILLPILILKVFIIT
jgi:Na+/H+ antiporter NhaD/arsenite permease-like protein